MNQVGRTNWYFSYTGLTLLGFAQAKLARLEKMDYESWQSEAIERLNQDIERLNVLIHEFKRDESRVFRLTAEDVVWFGIAG